MSNPEGKKKGHVITNCSFRFLSDHNLNRKILCLRGSAFCGVSEKPRSGLCKSSWPAASGTVSDLDTCHFARRACLSEESPERPWFHDCRCGIA